MDKLDLIEKYLEGGLTEKEKEAFLEQLETDPELLRLFQFRKGLAKNWNKDEAYNKTKVWVSSAIKEAKDQKRKTRQRVILMAASILILASLGSIWLFSRIGGPSDSIKDKYRAETFDSLQEDEQLKFLNGPSYAKVADVYINENGIHLLYPTDLDSIIMKKDKLIFSWSPPLSGSGTLSVMDKNRQVLYSEELEEGDSLHIPTIGLELLPGIYYWYISDTTALPFFIVKDEGSE